MKFNATLLGMFLLAGNHRAFGGEDPGWYQFEFRTGGTLVARLSKVEGDTYHFLYQGSLLEVGKADLKGLRRVGSPEAAAKDHTIGPAAAPGGQRQSGAGREPAASEEQIHEAVEQLALLEDAKSAKAYKFLSANLPRARDILHDALLHPSAIVRGRAVKLLGQNGSAREDLQAVARRLNDPQPEVRLSAVMAVRTLGPDGAAALRGYLATENVANNLKMAIKTLHLWKDVQSVAPLVACMERENDQTAREFAERALEYLTGMKLGSDPAAWRAWLMAEESKLEQQKVLRSEELAARNREIMEGKDGEAAPSNEPVEE